MLKCLEGEAGTNLKLSLERILPDLSGNIKCGNSLIGHDFNDGLFAEFEQKKINPFDWNSEFADIMKKGGFDVVIGNPPYVRQEGLGSESKAYFEKTYSTFASTADLYTYFIEKAHKVLKQSGLFGMITSNKFMRTKYGYSLRRYLTAETTLLEIIDFGELPIFQDASTFPAILLTTNKKTKTQTVRYVPIKSLSFLSLEEERVSRVLLLDSGSLEPEQWTLADSRETKIFEKLKAGKITLKDYVEDKIFRGLLTGLNEAFVIDSNQKSALLKADKKSIDLIKPFVSGKELKRFKEVLPNRYLILIPAGWTDKQKGAGKTPWAKLESLYPAIAAHLKKFEAAALARFDKGSYWWELRACSYYDEFIAPKILLPDIAKESRMTYDDAGLFLGNTGYIIPTNDLAVLGILNSKLIYFYYKRNSTVLGDADRGGRLRWIYQDIKRIPFPAKFSEGDSKHMALVTLVERMLTLNKGLPQSKTPQERVQTERQIAATDREIDRLVYELYGLSGEEIKIVEG
jgi:hypothetical protein